MDMVYLCKIKAWRKKRWKNFRDFTINYDINGDNDTKSKTLKINKLGFIKSKSYYSLKDLIKRIKG